MFPQPKFEDEETNWHALELGPRFIHSFTASFVFLERKKQTPCHSSMLAHAIIFNPSTRETAASRFR